MRYALGPQSRKVYSVLRERVLAGGFAPGDRLPSHSALAAQFGVAPLTLRQALAQLEEEGLVAREQGRGTFVRAATPAPAGNGTGEPPDLRMLRESEQRFRATFEQIPIGMAHVDRTGRWLLVNPRLCELLGYSREELARLRFQDITPSDDLIDLTEWRRLWEGEIESYGREKRFVRGDGAQVWVNLTVSAWRDSSGTPQYAICTVEDIGERKRMEEALRATEDRYRIIFEGAPIGVSLSDLDGYIIVANEAYQRMVGYTLEELRRLRFIDLTHPDDIKADLDLFQDAIAGGRSGYELTKRYIRKDGRVIWVRLKVVLVGDAEGTPRYDVAMIEDITEQKQAEEALRESEARHRQMFERNQAIKLLLDPATGAIVDANPAACAFYGYPLEELRTMRILDINDLPPDAVAAEMTAAEREQRSYFLFRHVLASGEVRDVEVHSSPIETNGRKLLYSIIHDVTERKRFEEELEHQALHDALTGLPNRVLLHDRLEHALRSAQRTRTDVALLLMDLDRFKEINDTFGHHYGDRVLEQFGARLAGALRRSDTVARLGGDEFAVILPGVKEHGAVRVAEKLLCLGHEPVVVDGHSLAVDMSIGIALFPKHGEDVDTLLRRVDVAMYHAKKSGGGFAVYEPERDQYSWRRLELMNGLRTAIESDQLLLHYQPKLYVHTRRVTAMEALVRWQHPEYGLVPPGEFIPLAEHNGLIKPLTQWVLRQALRQCRCWREEGLEVQIEVNLSAPSLHDRRLIDMIAETMQSERAAADWLGLEITESTVMADPDSAMEVLGQIQRMGISISIDDFGTGYSSLRYLDQLPASELKIDRSFVHDMVQNESHCRIVQGTINLAHDLDLKVVAEGVEDQRTLDTLDGMGCDLAQGYYLGRPVPAAKCTRWLREHLRAE